MTKKELQQYFRSFGFDSSYDGKERVLYVHGVYHDDIHLGMETNGISINFNMAE